MLMTPAAGETTTETPKLKFTPKNVRRILCVFPRYTRSFGTMHHAYPLMRGVKAFMPPQGILLIASYMPASWEVRFVDENRTTATDADYEWADVVFMSGMHVQRDYICEINRRAHSFNKITVLGGPSVSGCPEWYPDIDILHCGELGDATDKIVARLDADVSRPRRPEVYITVNRLPLNDFPVPAYKFVKLNDYFLASVQFSSGCPYKCEFCDIPELYGRNPRLKTPKQVTAELDAMLERGNPGAVYFVDDNFIANQKAAIELLTELVIWQKARGYPVQFACEATLNLAQVPQALELMKEAYFCTVFCGIETPEEHALQAIHKEQNIRKPILEEIRTLNSYGLEVVSGIILGLDTDKPSTGDRIVEFIKESGIPMLTINILHALPKTPLWRRLEAANRIVKSTANRESNVEFLLPYETVVQMWLKCVNEAYTPDAIYNRFEHQMKHTFPNRKQLPATKARVNAFNIFKGLNIMARILWHVGVKSDYRKRFWQTAWPAFKKGKIEEVIHTAVVSHHMILFARECARGEAEKCFYGESPKRAETTSQKITSLSTRSQPSAVSPV
jgi:hopanoid C-2 methylase